MAAIFSMEITGRMYFSFCPLRNSRIVSGTKMISETSLVTNMDVKKTPKTRKRDSPVMLLKRVLNLIMGLKMFSFLKPSRTVSIMNRVPKVRQSMFRTSAMLGFVISIDTRAAIIASVSIISFLKNCRIFFMPVIVLERVFKMQYVDVS